MSYIPGITNTSTASANTAAAESKKEALGQDDFLNLLVAQLQNQDPMNPADATEFTAQLAQYSQLEQLFNLNDSMDQLASAQNNSERISALSLIGKEVVVEGSEFNFTGQPQEIGYKIEGPVSNVEIHVQNQYGKTVKNITVENPSDGNHFISWDGLNEEGTLQENGTYTITILSAGDEESAGKITPLVRTSVTGVDLSGGEPMLVTDSGQFSVSSIHGAFDGSKDEQEPGDGETSS